VPGAVVNVFWTLFGSVPDGDRAKHINEVVYTTGTAQRILRSIGDYWASHTDAWPFTGLFLVQTELFPCVVVCVSVSSFYVTELSLVNTEFSDELCGSAPRNWTAFSTERDLVFIMKIVQNTQIWEPGASDRFELYTWFVVFTSLRYDTVEEFGHKSWVFSLI